MDVKRFTELFNEMRGGLQDNDCSDYSQEAREWATKNGLIQGNDKGYMWQDMMTREQFVTVLYRFVQLMEKE